IGWALFAVDTLPSRRAISRPLGLRRVSLVRPLRSRAARILRPTGWICWRLVVATALLCVAVPAFVPIGRLAALAAPHTLAVTTRLTIGRWMLPRIPRLRRLFRI